MEKIKDNRGGARPGAGRKTAAQKHTITASIEITLLEKVKTLSSNRSQFINEAIREKLEKMEM